MNSIINPTPDPRPAEVLDALDRRLLNELQRDCAQTHQELAERVHASAPTCFRRIRRLVEGGVIERRVAIVSPAAVAAAVGWGITAIIEVTLERQSAEALDGFERHATAQAEVQQCYRVASGPDFVLIAHLHDLPAYHAFAHRALGAASHVRNVRCYFSTRRAKFEPAVML